MRALLIKIIPLELRIMWYAFNIDWGWVHDGTGESSKTSFILCSYHDPRYVMWKWALYWCKSREFYVSRWVPSSAMGSVGFGVPYLGGLRFAWQDVTI